VYLFPAQLLAFISGQVSMPLPQNDQNDQTAGPFKHEVRHEAASPQPPQPEDLMQKQPQDALSTLHDEQSARQSWMQTTVFTSAAASLVLPLVSDGALNTLVQVIVPPAQAAASNPSFTDAATTTAIGTSQGVVPAVSQGNQAAFSANAGSVVTPPGELPGELPSQIPSRQASVSSDASSGQSPLLTKSADGSWVLTYSAAPETQAVMAQLVQDTSHTQQICSGGSCRGLTYIDSQLPKVRQQLQSVQSQLQAFESTNTQSDLPAYKQLLANRLSEISQQKTQLTISANQTQQLIERIKIQLDSLEIGNISLYIAAQSLSQNADYQTTLNQLVRAEQGLAEEFSSANMDATALNEIYSDYAFQQQALQRLATEAFGSYLASPSAEVPTSIQQTPDALKLIQALTIAVYEDQVQQLRLGTIGQIEQKLSERQRQLIVTISQYERLQQQQASAQQLISGYEQARDRILTEQNTQLSKAEGIKAQSATALARARELAPGLPEGSIGQAVMLAVLAAGAIATIAAKRRSNQPTLIPNWTLQAAGSSGIDWQGMTGSSVTGNLATSNLVTSNLVTVPIMDVSRLVSPVPVANLFTAELGTVQPVGLDASMFNDPMLDLNELFADATPVESPLELYESVEAFEQRILQELQEITRFSTRLQNEAQVTQDQLLHSTENALQLIVDDSLTLELLTRNLDDILQQTTPEGSLAHEIRERGIAPVKVSLAEVDILAELAIRWIFKDQGQSPLATELTTELATDLATELDTAEAEAKVLVHSAIEDEAIKTKSLELKQHLQALATVAS
jgi:hypothetical protein